MGSRVIGPELAKAIAEGDEETTKRISAFFAPGGAIEKALQQATGPKVSVPVNLDIPQEKITVIGDLKQKLKELREEREQLSVTDSEALSKNSAEIAALEAQVNAIDGKTKATRELSEAEQLRNRNQRDAIAPVEAIGTDQVASGLSLGQGLSGQPAEAKPASDIAAERLESDALYYDQLLSFTSEANAQLLSTDMELKAALTQADLDYNNGKYQSELEYTTAKEQLIVQAAEKAIAEEERVKAVRQAATQQALGQAANLFNSLAGMAEENSEEQKALATVAALINTYQGATAALSAPDVLPQPAALIVKLLSVAAVVASGLASVKKIQGFEEGGFTTKAPSNKKAVGVVHANEWVAPADMVKHPKYGRVINSLESARQRGMSGSRNGVMAALA